MRPRNRARNQMRSTATVQREATYAPANEVFDGAAHIWTALNLDLEKVFSSDFVKKNTYPQEKKTPAENPRLKLDSQKLIPGGKEFP